MQVNQKFFSHECAVGPQINESDVAGCLTQRWVNSGAVGGQKNQEGWSTEGSRKQMGREEKEIETSKLWQVR